MDVPQQEIDKTDGNTVDWIIRMGEKSARLRSWMAPTQSPGTPDKRQIDQRRHLSSGVALDLGRDRVLGGENADRLSASASA